MIANLDKSCGRCGMVLNGSEKGNQSKEKQTPFWVQISVVFVPQVSCNCLEAFTFAGPTTHDPDATLIPIPNLKKIAHYFLGINLDGHCINRTSVSAGVV